MTEPLSSFRALKQRSQPICMLTCYSFPTAQQSEQAGVDIALVGDSLGTTFLGYDSTNKVTMSDMLHHVRAVRRGCPKTYVLADLPFRSYETPEDALANARALIDAGADGVKLEGALTAIISYLVKHGIDVCGHIGYLPQTADKPSVVGKQIPVARQLLADAQAIEAAGAEMLVLELMPKELSAVLTAQLAIPTIGIGAGADCDGQVQVIDDLLGMGERVFRHAKVYAQHRADAVTGIAQYCQDVREKAFPTDAHVSHVDQGLIDQL